MARLAIALVIVLAMLAPPVAADEVADFYRGKDIKIVIRASPGGNYDSYSRVLGRYIGKYIPGNPNILPINMPGAGGLTALNYLTSLSPHDGTMLTIVTPTMPMDQALGRIQKYGLDMRKLNWIGNMSDENFFLVTSRTSPTRTLEDAKHRVTPLGGTGAGDAGTSVVLIVNNILGTKFKIINGYRSSPELNMAMERGEMEARPTSNLKALFAAAATRPGSQGAGDYHVILQIGMKKDADYPNVPLLRDLAQSDSDKLVFDFLSRSMSIARPVATNQDVPAARVEALRRAFDATMKDPAFIAESHNLQLDVAAMPGAELQKLVNDIVDTPKAVADRINATLQEGASTMQRVRPPK